MLLTGETDRKKGLSERVMTGFQCVCGVCGVCVCGVVRHNLKENLQAEKVHLLKSLTLAKVL